MTKPLALSETTRTPKEDLRLCLNRNGLKDKYLADAKTCSVRKSRCMRNIIIRFVILGDATVELIARGECGMGGRLVMELVCGMKGRWKFNGGSVGDEGRGDSLGRVCE